MKTIREIFNLAISYLQGHNISNSKVVSADLLAHVIGTSRMQVYLDFDRPLTEEELSRYREGLCRLKNREPLQYIVGEVDFFGCKIKVNPSVLIPRNETEILVDMIANQIPQDENKILWDVCCGSGCIGIALKKKFPHLTVILSDISEEALVVAQENANINEVDVEFKHGNLLEPFKGIKADVIVCNPPYISAEEFDGLDPEVRDHEPRSALISGETGLECYRVMADTLTDFLNPGAAAWFEIGYNQGEEIVKIFPEGEVLQDWSGKDRFFSLK
jgi:release factor glutamine methyltransferase